MGIIDKMREHDYEQVVFCNHKSSGLRAIIVIHDTTPVSYTHLDVYKRQKWIHLFSSQLRNRN